MAEAEEVGQSCKAQPEPINNDEVPIKEIEIDSQNHKEDKVEEDEKDEETGEETEDDEDEQQKKLLHSSVNASNGCGNEVHVEVSPEKKSDENMDSPIDAVEKSINVQEGNIVHNVVDGGLPAPEASLKSESGVNQQPLVNDKKGSVREDTEEDNDVKLDVYDAVSHQSVDETIPRTHVVAAPNTHSSPLEEHMKEEEVKNVAEIEEQPVDNESRDPSNYSIFDTDTTGGGESGTEDEQAAFLIELDKFHKEKNMDFKPPRFYKGPLNLLKLWRSVLKLGGYDKVTACKYWRQVGESFNPPKTCTTVSWTFRMFYEKALLDYERHRASTDGSGIVASFPAPMGAEYQAPGAGRARRDAAARAMQGWHSQRVLDNGEVSDPIIKDKNSVPLSKKEKPLKSLSGVLKRKNPSSPDTAAKAALTKVPRVQSESTVIDIGSPADWVKINVRATKDCYEVYALVPGLLREEVRVQSDPAGRLVISGEPENPDNPWNVTPFKKVVSLPSRIDPHQTSAVVTLHGQLFVRVPFEQYD